MSYSSFNQQKKVFIQLINLEFYEKQTKTSFLEKWQTIIKNNEFCKLKFSYKYDDDDEYHQCFEFINNFNYIDRISGKLCFPLGQSDELIYIHANSKNIVIIHEDDVYSLDDINNGILEKAQKSPLSFLEFINILKPEITHTTLTNKNHYSQWLQIEMDNLCIRFSSNLSLDGQWDTGYRIQSIQLIRKGK